MKYVTDVPKDMPIRARASLRPGDFDDLEPTEQYAINDTLGLLYWNGRWKDDPDEPDYEEMVEYEVWVRIIGPDQEHGFKVHPGDELDLLFEAQDHGDLSWWEYIRPVEICATELGFELDGRSHMLFGEIEKLIQSNECPQFLQNTGAGELSLTYKVEWRLA